MTRGTRRHVRGPEARLEGRRNGNYRADAPVERRGPQGHRAADADTQERDAVLVEIAIVDRQRVNAVGDVVALAGELQIAGGLAGARPVEREHRESRVAQS